MSTTPYSISANSRLYTVVDDCVTEFVALITGMVTDELFGDFVEPEFKVVAAEADLAGKTTRNGLYAVNGYPGQSFPHLDTTSYTVDLVLSAPGFRDHPLSVTIPQNTLFPVAAPPVAMRRLPVQIQGRVVNDTTRAPIQGALITAIDDPVTPPTIHTLLLRSPLYFPHAAGVSVQQVNIAPTGIAQLTQEALAGTTVLKLTNRLGLAPNSIIQLASPSQLLVEYAIVDHVGPGPANQPGDVFLRTGLNRSYGAAMATIVQFVNAAPTGAPAQLASDADAGDGLLLLNQMPAGTAVVVDGGSPTAKEFHELGAVSNSDGYYSVQGIGRAKEIFLQASKGITKKNRDWFVEYDRPINVVDFRL